MRKALINPVFVWSLAIASFWISLYPGRFGADINSLILLMEQNRTTAHWTAIYFRFFQLITVDGRYLGFGSLVSLVFLAFTLENFLRSVSKSKKSLNALRLLIAFSPFFGVFGMTFDHQLFTTIGFLNCLAFLFERNVPILRDRWSPSSKLESLWLIFSLFLMQMTFQGIVLSLIFLLLIYGRTKSIVAGSIVIVLNLFSPNIFGVSTTATEVSANVADLRLAPLLGDIKCVVQHPKVTLTERENKLLMELGQIEKWKEPRSCIVADNAFFALQGSARFEKEIFSTWISLTKRYPQLVLFAHIQRSSMSLPPPFFRGQPNMIPTYDLLPPSGELSVELQQWSEVFKTSIDNVEIRNKRPVISRSLEPLPLLLAFFINQNSQFWGWGGLWLAITCLVLFLRRRNNLNSREMETLVPLLALSLFLFMISPGSACRYVMPQIFTGIILGSEYLLTWNYRRIDQR